MIAALFVQENGSYYGLDDVDPWPESRDACKYAGPHPVVAHPPCGRWCSLAAFVEKRHPHLRRGEDGGCFESALRSVRAFGGVLEHPAFSRAWTRYDLPRPPTGGGWVRGICGGWSCYVEQHAYGHPARKGTWLYACGVTPPSLRWGRTSGVTATATWCMNRDWRGKELRRFRAEEASKTPVAFRDVLLDMARNSR